jgi:hypothetical protein
MDDGQLMEPSVSVPMAAAAMPAATAAADPELDPTRCAARSADSSVADLQTASWPAAADCPEADKEISSAMAQGTGRRCFTECSSVNVVLARAKAGRVAMADEYVTDGASPRDERKRLVIPAPDGCVPGNRLRRQKNGPPKGPIATRARKRTAQKS